MEYMKVKLKYKMQQNLELKWVLTVLQLMFLKLER